jgi:hypothetical protein
MNEVFKPGFIHEVTNVAPNGKIIEIQKKHNIMFNEGLTNALGTVFNISTKDNYGYNYQCSKNFLFFFIESDYTPKVTDTIKDDFLDLYEVDFDTTFYNQKEIQLYSSDAVIGLDKKSLIIKTTYFNSFPRTITGIVLIQLRNQNNFQNYYPNLVYPSKWSYYKRDFRLLSAVKFNNPMVIKNGGTIKIKSTFIFIPS